MNKIKIILDTNIIISAFLFKNSKPRQVLEIAKNNHLLLLSKTIIEEMETVINRSKFDRYLALNKRKELLNILIESALIIEPNIIINECRDTKDNKYLELAITGEAECIITGDQDLLVLNPFQEIKIITVQEFLINYEEVTS